MMRKVYDLFIFLSVALLLIGGIFIVPSAQASPAYSRSLNRSSALVQGIARRPSVPTPVVTSWSPRDIAYPGQTLVINGRNFGSGTIVQLSGQGNHFVNLQISRRTSTHIEAKIRSFDYTGHRGFPLVIFNRGGQKKILDPNYKVVNRDASFNGESLWHAGMHLPDSIWTSGTVSLKLNFLEFRNSGTGTYRETVKLLIPRSYTEPCTIKGSHVSIPGKRNVTEFVFKTFSKNRAIGWSKLSDGRIQLNGVGLTSGLDDRKFNVIATINNGKLSIQYFSTSLETAHRYRRELCKNAIISNVLNVVPVVDSYVLIPAIKTLVEWNLVRADP